MPRLPVDGNKVIEHRITLGTYERQQLERFIDGMQVRNIGQGFGAATDPLEALFNTTTGTVGGAFFVAWALKRFFGISVPIPSDAEDLTEIWAAINNAIGLTPEERQELERRAEAVKSDIADEAKLFPVELITITRKVELFFRDLIFGKSDSIANAPDLYEQPTEYPDVDIDAGLQQTPDQYRAAVAARYVEGTYTFSYARYLLVQNGMSSIAASTFLDEAMGN